MIVMDKRTTFTLDEATVQRIKRLALRWKVSQAEVVRRSIERMERMEQEKRETVAERLELYYKDGGISQEKAEEYLREVANNRSEWGR
ncbi:MAG TPA: CopG family transcriptional regulator [Treponema sp.]|nr:CopG family transcriptional regulator [Treponema sp.]HPC72020.1 CopG family transcriptional regulator [Treponema sp.]HRU29079.1 CopG family transcriptional regulator [Treponema sp.]